jgi:hypothetical protein
MELLADLYATLDKGVDELEPAVRDCLSCVMVGARIMLKPQSFKSADLQKFLNAMSAAFTGISELKRTNEHLLTLVEPDVDNAILRRSATAKQILDKIELTIDSIDLPSLEVIMKQLGRMAPFTERVTAQYELIKQVYEFAANQRKENQNG